MLPLVAALALQASSPAVAPAPTFCERMARTWKMGKRPNIRSLGGYTYFTTLKSRGDLKVQYFVRAPDDSVDVPASNAACRPAEFGGTCSVKGPGMLVVTTDRFTRRFESFPGEQATFDTNARLVNCIETVNPMPPAKPD